VACRDAISAERLAHDTVTETGLLIFERDATYVDRGVVYLVEVDGAPQSPKLHRTQSIEVPVKPGEHVVRVSTGRRRFFEARVAVNDDEARRLRVVPGSLLSGLRRPPRLTD
jgi:hypothetical protein